MSSKECIKRVIPSPEEPEPPSFVCVCNANSWHELEPFNPVEIADKKTLVYYVTSRAQDRLTKKSAQFNLDGNSNSSSDAEEESTTIIEVDEAKRYQSVQGFGGAFTDAAGINIAALSEETRLNLLKSYFHKDSGIGYTVGRVPIASCDFSTREYSYLDKDGDFELVTFALAEEDLKYKIPYITKANELSGGLLKLFASPWSAPAWMKTNKRMKGGGKMIPEDRYYTTWAKYFRMFFEEYSKKGIQFWGLTMQNEARSDLSYSWQTMDFPVTLQRDFAYKFLSPELKKSLVTNGLKIMGFDDNRGEAAEAAEIFYSDKEKAKSIDGIGVHWYDFGSFSNLSKAHKLNSEKFILSSEQCIDTAPKKPLYGNWARGQRYGIDIVSSLRHWSIGWVDWNICVDMLGGPNWVENWVDAPIIVNKEADEFYKQPIFYFMAHFSKYIHRGYVHIGSRTTNRGIPESLNEVEYEVEEAKLPVKHVAFKSPYGNEYVIVLINTDRAEQTVKIRDRAAGKQAQIQLPADSIITAVWA